MKDYVFVVQRAGFPDYAIGGFTDKAHAWRCMGEYIKKHPTGNLGSKTVGKVLRRYGITNLELTYEDKVKSCPFCGDDDVELQNTHTACYWIECCGCGAQVTGRAYGGDRSSEFLSPQQHRLAKKSAIAAWNRRAP